MDGSLNEVRLVAVKGKSIVRRAGWWRVRRETPSELLADSAKGSHRRTIRAGVALPIALDGDV